MNIAELKLTTYSTVLFLPLKVTFHLLLNTVSKTMKN